MRTVDLTAAADSISNLARGFAVTTTKRLYLKGDEAVQVSIAGLVDHAHATFSVTFARPREHDVGRLQIPAHDLSLVSLLQRLRNLHGQPERFLQGQRPSRHPVPQALPLDVLHYVHEPRELRRMMQGLIGALERHDAVYPVDKDGVAAVKPKLP